MKSLLARYAPIPWRLKLFFRLRLALTPYADMIRDVPEKARVLDLGCGHGFLSLLLAEAPGRSVLGLDHDPARIDLANHARRGQANLEFRLGGLAVLPAEARFDAIFAIDFLHYFGKDEQVLLLRELAGRLAPGGKLIFREIDPEGGLASKLNRFYEWLATSLGFTRSDRKSEVTLRTPQEWNELASDLGLATKHRPCTHFLFADVLFTGRKEGVA